MTNVARSIVIVIAFILPPIGIYANSQSQKVSREILKSVELPNIPGNNLTALTIVIEPHTTIPSHKHDGFLFVYVLEGSIISQLTGEEPIEYTIGQSWVEPPNIIHAITKNPSHSVKAKLLAVFIAKTDAQLTSFEK